MERKEKGEGVEMKSEEVENVEREEEQGRREKK